MILSFLIIIEDSPLCWNFIFYILGFNFSQIYNRSFILTFSIHFHIFVSSIINWLLGFCIFLKHFLFVPLYQVSPPVISSQIVLVHPFPSLSLISPKQLANSFAETLPIPDAWNGI
jgi:hypothetical protein